jgi:hypothetical protein
VVAGVVVDVADGDIMRRLSPARSNRSTSNTSRPSEVVARVSGTSMPTRRASSIATASAFTTGKGSDDNDNFAIQLVSSS